MSPARILIVEDDRVVSRDIQQQLVRMGHAIAGVTSRGESALPLALETSPDLVLMDVRLEGELDGVDAARLLRERCHVPVVFLTAYADDETVRRAVLAEPYGYILKPFEDLQLRTVVEMALYKHQAERRLRESERRYALTLSSIGDAVIATDSEANITFINPVAEVLTGWPADKAQGRPLADVFCATGEATGRYFDDPATQLLEPRVAGGTQHHALLLSVNGHSTPIEASASPIVAESGIAGGLVLVFRNVTERRQAEEASLLRKMNARLEFAMQGSDIGAWEVDMADGDFMNGPTSFVNVWERLGYSRPTGPVTPEAYLDILHPDDRLPAKLATESYLQGHTPSFTLENRVRRVDGTYRWMLARGAALRDATGRATGFAGTLVDITDLKQVEQALRESEARFRGTFEIDAVGVAHIDLAGRFLLINQRYCDIVGYSREALRQMNCQDLTEPSFCERSVENLARLERGEVNHFSEEKLLITGRGEQVWVDVSVALQRDAAGAPMHMIAILEDISPRKRLEAAVSVAKEAAESANRAKDQFLANISHELRTPLNGILGYTQILRRDASLTSKQMASLGIIQQSGEHLLTLINDILDFSRIEAGKLALHVTDVPLMRFLNVIAEIVRVRAEQKRLILRFDAENDLPQCIRVDERRLRQVLLNLLANAIKFTDAGEVTLSVRTAVPGRLRFEVRDTGVGISADRLDSIFQPFEQAGELTRQSSGTGLGLAISRELIRLMGSEIRVASTVGAGSVFMFELDAPVSDVELTGASLQRYVSGYEGEKKTVLVIDDVVANRLLIVDTLERLGFDVIESDDGADGLAKAEAFDPDLILLDSVMPGMCGVEALGHIRRVDATRRVPVIVISADVSDRNMRLSKEAGADSFLAKPVDLDLLLAEMAALLGLNWTHQSTAEPQGNAAIPSRHAAEPDADMVVPPSDELAGLHRFALLGSMRDITELAWLLEKQNARYRRFAAELRRLAANFESQALLRLIESCLSKGDQV